MAQAGIHSMVGLAMRKWIPNRNWLMLGIVLGNLIPDVDNLVVAIATVMGKPTEGLHRTFTHSLFFVVMIIMVFMGLARATKRPKWGNLGLGLGFGVMMHILVDLLIWFDGVEILWPISSWINLWQNVDMPDWWSKLMMPLENLFFMLYFLALAAIAQKKDTNPNYLPRLRFWSWVQGILFLIFLVMVYTMGSGFMTIFGAVYLLSLGLAFGITIRMKETIEVFG